MSLHFIDMTESYRNNQAQRKLERMQSMLLCILPRKNLQQGYPAKSDEKLWILIDIHE